MSLLHPAQPVAPLALRQRQAAAALGLSVSTLSELTARGEVPCIRLGRRTVLYPVEMLAEWLRRKQADAVQSPVR